MDLRRTPCDGTVNKPYLAVSEFVCMPGLGNFFIRLEFESDVLA